MQALYKQMLPLHGMMPCNTMKNHLFMRKKINFKAFTLVELLVASGVVGIVMLGVISSNMAMQRDTIDFTKNYSLIQNTNNTLNHILNSASLMVGSPSDVGFAYKTLGTFSIGIDDLGHPVYALLTGDNNTFCFNQNDPPTYKTWVCYTYDPNSYNIYWCKSTNTNTCTGTNGSLLGTAKSMPTVTFTVNPTHDPNQSWLKKALFEISIDNCSDPSQVCSSGGGSTNPFVTKSGSVSPPAYSVR